MWSIPWCTDRALTLCDEEHRNSEIRHIEKALKSNGYPTNLVHKAVKKQMRKQSEEEVVEDEHKCVTFMPFVKGVSDKIC